MKVLVNGVGNIGKTILGLLCDYKSKLNIDEIYALKNTAITDWNKEELRILGDMGVVICKSEIWNVVSDIVLQMQNNK